jgi:hypothetical protein
MFKPDAADRFLARLLAGVLIAVAIVAVALEAAISRSQAFI